jgi:predicted enzyme related to lactoylglutathione lyase
MSANTPRPGAFCWFELATSDQAAAKRFYESLFGWSSADTPMGPAETYTTFKLGGRDAAAAHTLHPGQKQAGVPPNWMVYVLVENADASAARAGELGGTVLVPPFDVMTMGRMSVLQDPTGAYVSIWQAKDHVGIGAWGEIGAVSWADLQTRDQARAGEFYAGLFGWKMVEGKSMAPAKPGSYFHIMNGSEMIGGIPPAEHTNPNAPPHWVMYVEIADCAATTKQAASLGGRPHVDCMDIGKEGTISVIADPQGAVFAIHQTRRQ